MNPRRVRLGRPFLFPWLAAFICLPFPSTAATDKPLPPALAPAFRPPPELENDFGDYRPVLTFDDGTKVQSADDWPRRRKEILDTWTGLMGQWPPLIERPKVEYLAKERREDFTQHRVRVETAPGRTGDGYLLVPDGPGPFPAVLVVFYDPETSIGLKGERRDFAYQLTTRGFVTLSIGSPGGDSRDPPTRGGEKQAPLQPLSYLAYVAANCHTALAQLPQVDPKRIGVTGHSYGGKWAMFAACLDDRFACGAWSDPGVAFDEQRPNVNYWEPWYLGYDPDLPKQRDRGVITPERPRTGAYKRMIEGKHDLHEVQALMAPRPFLVSGGSEDPPERWRALNHARAVNKLLGHDDRVGMTNRPKHDPTEESNERLYEFFEHFLK